mmetsp:Transcript_97609/g.119562  ORF Transcript_97609/g.119562 Transcript_97609/m.119562 type:complete len:187 (-) Transcript_97609:57-617(-)
MGHAACALGCADRGCSGCGSARTNVVEVEVSTETLSSRPRRLNGQAEGSYLESWHGTMSSTQVPLEVRPVKKPLEAPGKAKSSHLAPLPTLHLDMPAAVATAFLESTRAEADAKYRRKLACRAARAEAAGLGGQAIVEVPESPVVEDRAPIEQQVLGLDGKFVSSGAIRQRLQEMEDASMSMNRGR